MSHSVPDAVGIAIETAAGRVFHTGDWKLDHTPVDGLRTDVGKLAELGNRGVDLLLRRLDERRAARLHAVRARRRRGVPADHPGPPGPRPDLELRLEHPPDAAGDRRRRRGRPQGGRRRPLDAPQPERRAQPRLHRDARGVPRPAAGPRRAAAAAAADPLHRLAGRAAVGAHADRLQRPPGDQGRARRHGDHLRAAGARERAARARRDQPPHPERRRGAARGERAGARLRPRARRGAAHAALPRPPEGGDADPRRVPDAGRARAARAGRRACPRRRS